MEFSLSLLLSSDFSLGVLRAPVSCRFSCLVASWGSSLSLRAISFVPVGGRLELDLFVRKHLVFWFSRSFRSSGWSESLSDRMKLYVDGELCLFAWPLPVDWILCFVWAPMVPLRVDRINGRLVTGLWSKYSQNSLFFLSLFRSSTVFFCLSHYLIVLCVSFRGIAAVVESLHEFPFFVSPTFWWARLIFQERVRSVR